MHMWVQHHAEPGPLPLPQNHTGSSQGTGEGLRSAPAIVPSSSCSGGVSALSPDAGWVPGTHWEPPKCCQCGGQEGLGAMLQPVAESSCQPAGPPHCIAGRERLWFVQMIHLQAAFNVLFFCLVLQGENRRYCCAHKINPMA